MTRLYRILARQRPVKVQILPPGNLALLCADLTITRRRCGIGSTSYNLDAFLQEVYSYYEGKGIYSIALSRGLNLLSVTIPPSYCFAENLTLVVELLASLSVSPHSYSAALTTPAYGSTNILDFQMLSWTVAFQSAY